LFFFFYFVNLSKTDLFGKQPHIQLRRSTTTLMLSGATAERKTCSQPSAKSLCLLPFVACRFAAFFHFHLCIKTWK
jgi:hypothetical protein